MFRSLHNSAAGHAPLAITLGGIRKKLARAMVGSTVDLMADGKTILHGVVARVRVVAGTPKIVVNGRAYDMSQVLTSTNASLHP